MPASCRTCGKELTIDEFRACAGLGHYCTTHLPAAPIKKASTTRKTAPSEKKTTQTGSRRGRRVSESGVVEYSCRAQFARTGSIKRGKLTTDHPSCLPGEAVFVCSSSERRGEEIGHGPGEIVTLFITDSEGLSLARKAGFECQ